MIQDTIEYTRERQIFGRPVLDNQVVHFTLAELQTEVEALRALVYRATELYVAGQDVTALASMAKLKAGRLTREVSDKCLQYWGGMGFTWDNLLGQGEGRQFVWMPLSKDSAIRPKKDALRIESPKGSLAVFIPESPPPRRIPPVNETATNTSAKAETNGQTNGRAATDGQAKPEAANRRTSNRKGARRHRGPDRAGREVPRRGPRSHAPGERPGKGVKTVPPPEPGDQDHPGQHRRIKGLGV